MIMLCIHCVLLSGHFISTSAPASLCSSEGLLSPLDRHRGRGPDNSQGTPVKAQHPPVPFKATPLSTKLLRNILKAFTRHFSGQQIGGMSKLDRCTADDKVFFWRIADRMVQKQHKERKATTQSGSDNSASLKKKKKQLRNDQQEIPTNRAVMSSGPERRESVSIH